MSLLIPIAGKFVPGVFERQDEPLCPMSALREANAICHREYGESGSNVSIAIFDERQVHSVSVELNERQKFVANIFYNNPNNAFSLRDVCSIVNDSEISTSHYLPFYLPLFN